MNFFDHQLSSLGSRNYKDSWASVKKYWMSYMDFPTMENTCGHLILELFRWAYSGSCDSAFRRLPHYAALCAVRHHAPCWTGAEHALSDVCMCDTCFTGRNAALRGVAISQHFSFSCNQKVERTSVSATVVWNIKVNFLAYHVHLLFHEGKIIHSWNKCN